MKQKSKKTAQKRVLDDAEQSLPSPLAQRLIDSSFDKMHAIKAAELYEAFDDKAGNRYQLTQDILNEYAQYGFITDSPVQFYSKPLLYCAYLAALFIIRQKTICVNYAQCFTASPAALDCDVLFLLSCNASPKEQHKDICNLVSKRDAQKKTTILVFFDWTKKPVPSDWPCVMHWEHF